MSAEMDGAAPRKRGRPKGLPHSPETRARMSEAKKRAWADPETRARMSEAQRGKKHSPETRARMSEAKRGKKLSPEHRAAIKAGRRRQIAGRIDAP